VYKAFLYMLMVLIVMLSGCKPRFKHHYNGYTDTLYLYLSSPSQGYLKYRPVQRGTYVSKNQLIYILDSEPEASQLKAAKFALAQAKRQLMDLRMPRRLPEIMAIQNQVLQVDTSIARVNNHLNRLLKLKEQQFVDKDTLDFNEKTLQELKYQKLQIQENLKLSKMGARIQQINAQRAAINVAKNRMKEVEWYLQSKVMKAPSNGYVFDVFYSVGELVPAGKPVVSMVVPQNNYVEFFVSSEDISSLKLHDTIYYQFYGDKQYQPAHIYYISKSVEYMPPVLFTPEYQHELVFRVRAVPFNVHNFTIGQPVEVFTR
jgi:HlyD family secretion protein